MRVYKSPSLSALALHLPPVFFLVLPPCRSRSRRSPRSPTMARSQALPVSARGELGCLRISGVISASIPCIVNETYLEGTGHLRDVLGGEDVDKVLIDIQGEGLPAGGASVTYLTYGIRLILRDHSTTPRTSSRPSSTQSTPRAKLLSSVATVVTSPPRLFRSSLRSVLPTGSPNSSLVRTPFSQLPLPPTSSVSTRPMAVSF